MLLWALQSHVRTTATPALAPLIDGASACTSACADDCVRGILARGTVWHAAQQLHDGCTVC
jgi:hypothetical protein